MAYYGTVYIIHVYTVNVLFKQYSNKTNKFHRVKSFRPNKTKQIIR